jgi:hypothetical protein
MQIQTSETKINTSALAFLYGDNDDYNTADYIV